MSWGLVIGAFELVLIGIALVIGAAVAFGAPARRMIFVAVGVMGLLMLFVVGAAALFSFRLVASRDGSEVAPQVSEGVHVDIHAYDGNSAKRNHPSPVSKIKIIDKPVTDGAEKENRPTWVDTPTGLKDGKYEKTVSAGPYGTTSECELELVQQLRAAVAVYVNGYIRPGASDVVSFTDHELLNLAPQRWVQHVDTSVGPMVYHHARLVLDDSARGDMKARWRKSEIEQRLLFVGGGAGVVLCGLLGCYVVLKSVARSP